MMKKSYICVYLTIAVCFLSGACQERNPHLDAPEQTGKLTVTMAQASFQDLAPKLSVTAVITRSGVPVTAIWNYARSYQVEYLEMVQAPVNIVPGYSYTLNSADSVIHRIIANTVTFLVAQKEEGQQEISYRVVRFIAQDDWLMDNPSKLFRLTLASLGSYTGKILYYDTSGRLLEGAVYQAGEQTGSIRPADADHFITRSEPAGNCYYEYITVSPTVASRSGNPTCEVCQAYGYACMAHRDHEIDEVVVIGNRPTLWPCNYDTGGEGSGGTTGGGGGSAGGGGGSNPPTNPTTNNKTTPAKITSAAKKSVEKYSDNQYKDSNGRWKAHCNWGVRDAFNEIFSTNELNNMNANAMTQYWENSSKWESITISQAQSLANEGWFVVAGWINSSGSGHVAMVVPGVETTKNWNGSMTSIPNVMDTGGGMRAESQPVNRSFGTGKHASVNFYKYK